MGKYTTQLFGEVTFDETLDSRKGVHMFFSDKIKNGIMVLFSASVLLCKNKIEKCFNIIDRYFEIKNITAKTISKKFIEDNIFRNYLIGTFESYLDEEKDGIVHLDEYTINQFVEKMEILNLSFCLENEKINLNIDYGLNGWCIEDGKFLYINMDDQLNVIECDYKLIYDYEAVNSQ